MRQQLFGGILLAVSVALGAEVEDNGRACPEGYFYGGEVTKAVLTSDQVWEAGPRSPVYSCYRILELDEPETFDWVNATKKCGKYDGQLLSVNNYEETSVLTGELFLTAAFGKEGEWDKSLPRDKFFTSGISLAEGKWAWFGAGNTEDSQVDPSMTEGTTSPPTINGTSCLAVSFEGNTSTVTLKYTVIPCLDTLTATVCEVRVYEQVWYVWFTTNWLQILFLLTLVMLLISTCLTFQIWVTRPSRRAGATGRPSSSPPAYTVREEHSQIHSKGMLASAADRYTEKGKELMAKVVFYRKPEDKQRLSTA